MEVVIHSTLQAHPGHVTVATDPSQTVDSLIAAFCIERGILHQSNYILLNNDQDELTGHQKLATCGVLNGDVLFLGVKNNFFTDEWWGCCNQWWLLATVTLLIGFVGLVAIIAMRASGGKRSDQSNGIILDAGSSHTQLFLYDWSDPKVNGTGEVTQHHTCRISGGGIQTYTSPYNMSGFQKCLDEVSSIIPSNKHKETPIYLAATAGMRLLRENNETEAKSIMSEVRRTLSKSPFNFSDPLEGAKIMEGKDEGAFSWVTVNFLSRVFGEHNLLDYMSIIWSPYTASPYSSSATLGAMDLGGASTQMTFTPLESHLPENYSQELTLFGREYLIYTHSYLCYGINEAFRQYRAELVKESNYSKNAIADPCQPLGNQTVDAYNELFEVPCTLAKGSHPPSLNVSFTFEGTSNSSLCHEKVLELFNFTAHCPMEPCTFNGIYQPHLNGNFMAFSGYYYMVSFLNLTAMKNFTLADYVTAMDDFCGKNWTEVSQIPDSSPDAIYIARYCFRSHFVNALLTQVFGFNDTNWHRLTFANQINGNNIGWSMGYMLNITNMLTHVYPSSDTISLIAFILLVILFVAFIIIGACFVCYARKNRRERGEYRRLSTYGTI